MANSTLRPDMCVCMDMTIEDYSPMYESVNFMVIILALPIVSAFGICSNIVNVFIYTRPSMRCSANTYLTSLAVSDFFVVITGLFIFWIDSARSYLLWLKYAPYIIVYTLPIGYIAQTCSVYFTVAAALDCYVKVCWSAEWPRYNTIRCSHQIVLSIAVLSCVYNSLRFGQFALQICKPYDEDLSISVVEICTTALFRLINKPYNVYSYMVLMTFLPFALLLLLNAFIVLKVGPAPTASHHVLQGHHVPQGHDHAAIHVDHQSPAGVDSAGADDTITMIMVVVLFLACNTLALVVNIVETFFEPQQLLLNYMTDISNFLVIFNSSVNFVIYLIFSDDFRRLFRYYLSCGRHADKANGYAMVATSGDPHQLPLTYIEPPPAGALFAPPPPPTNGRRHTKEATDQSEIEQKPRGIGDGSAATNNNVDATAASVALPPPSYDDVENCELQSTPWTRQQPYHHHHNNNTYHSSPTSSGCAMSGGADVLIAARLADYRRDGDGCCTSSGAGSVTAAAASPPPPISDDPSRPPAKTRRRAPVTRAATVPYYTEVHFIDDLPTTTIVLKPIDGNDVEKFV